MIAEIMQKDKNHSFTFYAGNNFPAAFSSDFASISIYCYFADLCKLKDTTVNILEHFISSKETLISSY